MPSKDASAPLEDIRNNALLAQSFVEGFGKRRFISDKRTVYAVTRCLEIISEASRRLPPIIKDRHPSIPWADISGAGNVYRHDYEDVSAELIWNTVKKLGNLLKVVEHEIEVSKRRPAGR